MMNKVCCSCKLCDECRVNSELKEDCISYDYANYEEDNEYIWDNETKMYINK